MFNRTTNANPYAPAARALAILLLTNAIGVKAIIAQTDIDKHTNPTRTAQFGVPEGYACPSGLNQQCAGGLACILYCCVNNLPGSFGRACHPAHQRGEQCSANHECASGRCDPNPTAPSDPTGNNYHYGLCE